MTDKTEPRRRGKALIDLSMTSDTRGISSSPFGTLRRAGVRLDVYFHQEHAAMTADSVPLYRRDFLIKGTSTLGNL